MILGRRWGDRSVWYCMIYVKIEETKIYPTNKQAQACLRVCQMLSSYYRDIQLFRFDSRLGDVYVLAGDNIQIIIPPDGNWRFIG